MDLPMDNACPHCGRVQPKDSLTCGACGGKLGIQTEKATRLLQPQEPGYSRRRRLIVGLVVGGVGLTAIGSGVGTVLLRERGVLSILPSAPANLPVDKHRLLTLPFPKAEQTNSTWLPDNTHLLGFDSQTLFLLDVKSGKKDWVEPSVFPSRGLQSQILWSANRRYVAEVGDAGSVPNDEYRAAVWDIQSRQRIWISPPLGHLGNTFDPCALAPGGVYFALCQDTGDINDSDSDNIVQIWDIQKNRLIKSWRVQDPSLLQGQMGDFAVTALAWSPDNTRLVVICAGGSVQLWDATSASRLWTYPIANGRGASVQWSPDGTTLALWGIFTDTPITMLDARTGNLLFQTSGVNFSSDRMNMNGASPGRTQRSGPVVWSSDGKRLALLVYENSTYRVQIYDAHTGRRVFTCQPVEGQLTGCSWSPDGRYLAAGNIAGGYLQDGSWGEDSTIQFWDAQSGQSLFSYQAPRAPGQLAWSPNSHLLAVYTPQDYGRAGMHVGFSQFALQVFEVV